MTRGVLPKPIPTECVECKATFMRTHARKRFCTSICKNRYYDVRRDEATRFRDHVCEVCGEAFRGRPQRRFCTRSCAARHKWATSAYSPVSGEAHPRWRGGPVASKRRRTYNLEPAQYEHYLAQQGGVCAICRARRGVRPLSVDHDHTTGEIRGLLCGNCNTALGLMADNPVWLQAAISYLASPPARHYAPLAARGQEADEVGAGDPALPFAAP